MPVFVCNAVLADELWDPLNLSHSSKTFGNVVCDVACDGVGV